MNILILNWRDPKNNKSGGAEKLNMHIIDTFINRGDHVTWYAVSIKGLPNKEKYKGITIIRFGNPLTHFLAWPFFYWANKFGKIDLIIDSIHGTGYLSAIVVPKKKKIILICEVAQNIWDEMYSFPINKVGKIWEKIMFVFYRNNQFWTISQSTSNDLNRYGISKKNIKILPMGFDGIKTPAVMRYIEPTALFVGRLAEMKGVQDAIRAIVQLNKDNGIRWRLHIIGRGGDNYEQSLKMLVKDTESESFISFLGYVSENKKFIEMARSWVLLVPSSREGWGMIVPEANSVGTAVISYDVSGLRDVSKAYSTSNILVKPSYLSLVRELSKIKVKPIISNRPKPGWIQLHDFVRENV